MVHRGMLVVGVDENGLGPRLGPLVATAMTLEVRGSYDAGRLRRRGLALGVTDSKQVSGFGNMAFAESVALALVERSEGVPMSDADAFLAALCLDPRSALPCPDHGTARQCWSQSVGLPAFGGDPAEGREVLRKLEGRGTVRLRRVRSAVACSGVLNRELEGGRNKLRVDLALFEGLVLDARRACLEPVDAVCGMVGGIRDYVEYFSRFSRAVTTSARKGRREYAVPDVGNVRFEVDADRRHLPVALASIVGKYVRELWMHRMHRFYSQYAQVRPASGYHDPVTRRFMLETLPVRERLGVAKDCFERRR